MLGKTVGGFGLTISAILVVAAIGAGPNPPAPRPPKPESRNEHCQITLLATELGTDLKPMGAMEKVNWCPAQGYGWDEYKPAPAAGPQRKLDPKTKLLIMAHIAADQDWAIQHCHVKSVPVIGLDGALHELLPRWKAAGLGDEKTARREITAAYRERYQAEEPCDASREHEHVKFIQRTWLDSLKELPVK
jgi:hypothetical protein